MAVAVVTLAQGRLAGATPTSADAQTPAGVYGSTASVTGSADASGAFTFGVPLDLPTGRGSVQPRLSLGYRSSARSGNAGYGFNLSVPSIEMAPLSGNPVFPNPDPNHDVDPLFRERLTYGGTALVLICQVNSPTHPCTSLGGGGANDVDYAADVARFAWQEGGNFSYFRLQVEDGTPTRFFLSQDRSTWRVLEKGGRLLTFGGTEEARERDSRKGAPGGIVRWHLTSEEDARNPDPSARDRSVYRWVKLGARGHAYLRDAYYTPPVAGSSSDADWSYHVELRWKPNPHATSSYGSPLGSAPDHLLEAIGVSAMPFTEIAARRVHRIYRLDYLDPRESGLDDPTKSPLFHEAFLHRVREEGRCDRTESEGHIPFASDCAILPPTVFGYEGHAVGSSVADVSQILNGSFAPYHTAFYAMDGVTILDLDRDGLPDLVQGWPSSPRCTALAESGEFGEFETVDGVSRLEGEGIYCYPAPECRSPDDCDAAPPPNHVTWARPMAAFLNEGRDYAAPVRLRHQCMDAADPAFPLSTPFGLSVNPGVPGFLTRGGSTTLLGNFSQSSVAWQRAEFMPMLAVPIADRNGPQGDCLLPMRTPSANFAPTWMWRRAQSDWARPAPPGFDNAATFVDVDGDGLVDALQRRAIMSGELSEAHTVFSRRYARYERTVAPAAGDEPAQVPFAEYETDIVSVAPRPYTTPAPEKRSFYVDVNGDGLSDLVTVMPGEDGGVPRVRPGDGVGRFACDETKETVAGCVPGDISSHYSLALPAGAESPLPFTDETAFHDVTGDGLADIVKMVESPSQPGVVELWLWVNLDGHTFACVGTATGPGCSAAYFFDSVHQTFAMGRVNDRRLMFADMDANGVDDVVLVTKSGVHVASLMRLRDPGIWSREHGPRPGLLTRIDNGRGASTRVTYDTVQALDLAARATTEPWQHHSRKPATVVTAVRHEDAVVDSSWQTLPEPFGFERATYYTYRDPAYDRWEGRMIGFRRIREAHEGESAVTETTYWFSECQNDILADVNGSDPELRCRDGSSDEPAKGRVGRPVLIERFIPGILGC